MLPRLRKLKPISQLPVGSIRRLDSKDHIISTSLITTSPRLHENHLRLVRILLLHTNKIIRRHKRIKRPPLLPPIAHARIVLRPLLASFPPPQAAVLASVDDTRLAIGVWETAAGPAAFFDLAAAVAHVVERCAVDLGDLADVPDFEEVVPFGLDGGDAGTEGEEGDEEGEEVHFWWWCCGGWSGVLAKS